MKNVLPMTLAEELIEKKLTEAMMVPLQLLTKECKYHGYREDCWIMEFNTEAKAVHYTNLVMTANEHYDRREEPSMRQVHLDGETKWLVYVPTKCWRGPVQSAEPV